jgi:hypothetical protein
MRWIKGALSMLAVAAIAVTFTACPPAEQEPATFDDQRDAPGETQRDAPPPRDTIPR